MLIERLNLIRLKMKELKLDAMLLSKSENCNYLINYHVDRISIVITVDKVFIVLKANRRFEEELKLPYKHEILTFENDFESILNSIIKVNAIHRLGFESAFLTMSKYSKYSKSIDCNEFVPVASLVEDIRFKKDYEEIESIRKASTINDEVFKYVVSSIKPGIREVDFCEEVNKNFNNQRTMETLTCLNLSSGEKTLYPDNLPSIKVINLGELINISITTRHKCYYSKLIKTILIGKATTDMKSCFTELKNIVNLRTQYINDIICNKYTSLHDYEIKNEENKIMRYSALNGIGLEDNEAPKIEGFEYFNLQTNMVLTLLNELYYKGHYAIKTCDTILISKNYLEFLNMPQDKIVEI